MNKNSRISIPDYAILLAQTAACRSEDPFRKVGAAALDFNHRVIGCAYNGLGSGIEVDEEFWLDRDERLPYMLHAEVNLTSLFKRGEAKIVAVTTMPCSACARMLCAYGVKEVYYNTLYERDDLASKIFSFYNVKHQLISESELQLAIVRSGDPTT